MKLKSQLMSTEEIRRALKRIAHQITEKNNGVDNVVLLGIKKGGLPISKFLGENLEAIEGAKVPLGFVDISGYRDDKEESLGQSFFPIDINNKTVILVDDVLYTGRTVRSALDVISKEGRASRIQLAVLIDRGHRELPIRADYVGKNIPTSEAEIVSVDFDQEGKNPQVNIYDK